MKKIILSMMAVSAMTAAQAQPGSILLYGDLGLNSSTSHSATSGSTDGKSSTFSINPGIGYQFNKHMTVGLNIGYYSYKMNNIGSKDADKYVDMNYGPFIRYAQSLNRLFTVYGQLNISLLSGNHQFIPGSGTGYTDKYSGFGASFAPAIGIHVWKGVALNLSLGGIDYKTKSSTTSGGLTVDKYTESNFDLNFAKQATVGFSVNFGGHAGHAHHKGHHAAMDDTRRINSSDADEDDAPKKKSKKSDDE